MNQAMETQILKIADSVETYFDTLDSELKQNLFEDIQKITDAKDDILREALNAMLNLSPRVKEYGGCFGKMAGGIGGEDCICTACKIRREIGDK